VSIAIFREKKNQSEKKKSKQIARGRSAVVRICFFSFFFFAFSSLVQLEGSRDVNGNIIGE
jgi:hypothetical protein